MRVKQATACNREVYHAVNLEELGKARCVLAKRG